MPKTVAIMFLSWGPAVVRYVRVEAMLGAFGFAGPASGLDLVGQDRQVAEPPRKVAQSSSRTTTAPSLDEFGITGSVLLRLSARGAARLHYVTCRAPRTSDHFGRSHVLLTRARC